MIEIGRLYHDVDNLNRTVVVTALSKDHVHVVFADEHPLGGVALLGARPDPIPVERFRDQYQ